MYPISLTFPDQTYASTNLPTTASVKSDLSAIETAHNALDTVVDVEHNTDGTHTTAVGMTGEVKIWTTPTIPDSWLSCDGSAISRTTYAGLFAAIGTIWGAGNGVTTFNIPDSAGKAIVGVSTTDGDFDLADTGGAKTYDVSHTHTGGSHTHTGPSHRHTGPSHRHTGPSHRHTGGSHTHSTPSHAHSVIGNTGQASSSYGSNTGDENYQGSPQTHSHAISFSTSSANGGNTGAGGTGNTGYQGTGNTSAGGTGNTGASGTAATGSGGSATQNVLNPFAAFNLIIKT